MSDLEPAWSPDGTRIAFVSDRHRDHDLAERPAIHVVDVETSAVHAVTGGPRSVFATPVWLDGATIAALGSKLEGRGGSRNDIWLFPADGSEATADGGRNLSGRHDLMPGSGVASDVTKVEPARLVPTPHGAAIDFLAPIDGSYELWRIATDDGAVRRLTHGRHQLSSFDAVTDRKRTRHVYLRSTPTEPPELWSLDAGGDPQRLTSFNADVLEGLTLIEPVERRSEVDGRSIQGWLMPSGGKPTSLVTQIHGGPHSLFAWSPYWEFQVLAAAGIGVFYCNPRGSEGYGQEWVTAARRRSPHCNATRSSFELRPPASAKATCTT